MNPLDPTNLSTAIAIVFTGLAMAIRWWYERRNGHRPQERETEEERIERIVEATIKRMGVAAKPPRLSASERKLRDRAIKALHRDKFDPDDIARVLNVTERVARKVLTA